MLRAVMCRNTAVKKSGTQKTPNKFHLKKIQLLPEMRKIWEISYLYLGNNQEI